jgi:cytoskeleton protein RodZ
VEQQNTPVTPPVGDAGHIDPPVKASVGDVLRATRLRLGVDLGAVATTLHIRVSFLEAIEAGNYDALPGGTYAVGFIRSYGEQLGLDGVELVRRFKQETGTDVVAKPEPPNFPAPVKTGGLPIGAIATGIAVAAGLAFAGWYLVAGGDSATTLLPRIPAALNEKITAPPAPRTEAPAAPSAQTETPPPPSTPVAEAPAPEPPTAMAPPPAKLEPPIAMTPAKPAPAPVAPAKTEAPKPVPPKPEPPKVEAPQASAPAAPPAAPAAPAPTKPVAPPPAPPRPVVDETTDAPPATPETLNRQARVYGEENTGARIELVASADAWVQVTENGSLVLTRLMHAGDRFLVPNRSGLTLMTGNAGGLNVLVDGQKAPPLGAQGQVVRDVALTAERLRGGR